MLFDFAEDSLHYTVLADFRGGAFPFCLCQLGLVQPSARIKHDRNGISDDFNYQIHPQHTVDNCLSDYLPYNTVPTSSVCHLTILGI